MIDRIPVMDYAERNAAKRFITLIDTLYDNAVKLMASAEADPVSLYRATDGIEANEFKRTAVAADRNELGMLPGAAAWPEGFRGERVEYGIGGDLTATSVIHVRAIAAPECIRVPAYLTEIKAGQRIGHARLEPVIRKG